MKNKIIITAFFVFGMCNLSSAQKKCFVATAKKSIALFPAPFLNASTTDSIYTGEQFLVLSNSYKSSQRVFTKTGKYYVFKTDENYYSISNNEIDFEKAQNLPFMKQEIQVSTKKWQTGNIKLVIDPYGKRYFEDKYGNKEYY